MRVANRTNENTPYTTWYEFRRDLGKKLGYIPLNSLWLEIKPKAPLPWSDSHMHASLSALAKVKELKDLQKE
jgi:hypothetical protein